jgi:hypothetical protein
MAHNSLHAKTRIVVIEKVQACPPKLRASPSLALLGRGVV